MYSKSGVGSESVTKLHLLVLLCLKCINKGHKNAVNSLLVGAEALEYVGLHREKSCIQLLTDCCVYGLSHMLSIFLWDLCLFLSLCRTKDYPTFCK